MKMKPKERLIDNALKLFRQRGFYATGVDTVLAEAKVSKTTLYRHFRSKEELIIAVLRRQDEEFRNWFMKTVDQASKQPLEKLLSVFDVYQKWAEQDDFNGCAFVKASAEFPCPESPIHALCVEHKRLMTRYIQELAETAHVPDANNIATQFMLLLDGATVLAQMTGKVQTFGEAKDYARKIVFQN